MASIIGSFSVDIFTHVKLRESRVYQTKCKEEEKIKKQKQLL